MAAARVDRRDILRMTGAGVLGTSMSGWLERLAAQTAESRERRRSCILLWMNGGPSQIDTFDPKPGHANGGPVRAIDTNVNGIRISEYLPRLARTMDKLALVRSMNTREGDHSRGTFLMRTGYLPQGPIQYPPLGSLISKELVNDECPLPNFVSIAPYRLFSPQSFAPGFLGPRYAPLIVGDNINPGAMRAGMATDYEQYLRVQDMQAAEGVSRAHFDGRVGLLQDLERDFTGNHPGAAPASHAMAYDRAARLIRTEARTAFSLDDEPARLRDAYGRNLFGQGCLLARRLVERGVPFVEVTLGPIPGNPAGWDTHGQNFNNVRSLCEVLDPAWSSLMDDLSDRGLLDTTTVVWMGEFGRTPRINGGQGRDHFPNAWSTVIGGGGIRGGQVFGRTSADGMTIDTGHQRAVAVPDFLATVCRALGIDPRNTNMSNVARPIPITDHGATPIRELLA